MLQWNLAVSHGKLLILNDPKRIPLMLYSVL